MQKENDSRLLFLRGKPEIGLDARWLHREAFRVKVRKIADSKAARRGKTFGSFVEKNSRDAAGGKENPARISGTGTSADAQAR